MADYFGRLPYKLKSNSINFVFINIIIALSWFIFLTYGLNPYSNVVSDIKHSVNTELIPELSFQSLQTISLWQCMELCLLFKLCKAISINKDEKMCKLYEKTDEEIPGAVTQKLGSTYVKRTDFPSLPATECGNHSCGQNFVCHNNGGEDPKCVHVFYEKCRYPSVYFNEHCYTFKKTPQNWHDALLDCRADDADLVSIETKEENDWIANETYAERSEFQITTPASTPVILINLLDYGITLQDRSWYSLLVKSCGNAHVFLYPTNSIHDTHYLISIGSHFNQKYRIRRGTLYDWKLKSDVIDKPLDCNEYRPFWFSYEGGYIASGRGLRKGNGIVVNWTDPSPVDVKYLRIASWNTYTCNWIIGDGKWYWTAGNYDPSQNRKFFAWGIDANATSMEHVFTNWNSEPDNDTISMRCASFETGLTISGTGKWTDDSCTLQNYYICEKKSLVNV